MSIVGHELVVKDLKRLADAGDLPSYDDCSTRPARGLPHALLFFGPRRTGKRLVATGLAHYLEHKEFAVTEHILIDMMLLAPREKESIGVEEVRALQHFLALRPNVSPYRMAIVDGAEFLTTEAQNALLKLAEEPPEAAIIILVASDPDAILSTLRSRLQRFYFGPVGSSRVVEWLQKEHKVSAAKAHEAAQASHGVPGLAWDMLFNGDLQKMRVHAKRFLVGTAMDRKEFLKGISTDESFRLDAFLEALLLEMTSSVLPRPAAWHRTVGLRADASRFNLNPRLQLAALANVLT